MTGLAEITRIGTPNTNPTPTAASSTLNPPTPLPPMAAR
jgi:hypothetical protein